MVVLTGNGAKAARRSSFRKSEGGPFSFHMEGPSKDISPAGMVECLAMSASNPVLSNTNLNPPDGIQKLYRMLTITLARRRLANVCSKGIEASEDC